MMRRNLVIARVGNRSLHPHWLEATKERSWDLYLCPFQELSVTPDYDCTLGTVISGPKWAGLRELLNSWNGWQNYEYIWLPDDDILTSQDDVDAMFRLGEALQFNLFAPALQENSYYAHYITMRNRSFAARRVGFVEIMVPCFKTSVLKELLPTLDLTTTGWGWGLDSVWPKLLNYKGLGVLDSVPVLHTRAVGAFRDPDLGKRVLEESDRLLRTYSCGQEMVTFAGVSELLADEPLDPDDLLVKLIEGWRYLHARDPSVLRWTVEHQRALSDWPPYDIGGAPSGPHPCAMKRAPDHAVRKAPPLKDFGIVAQPIAFANDP